MSTLLHQGTAFQHIQAVGVGDTGEPVGDANRGPPTGQPLQSLVDRRLGAGIQGGCCFVQEQQGRIAEDRAGNGQPLSLPLSGSWKRRIN